VIGDLTGFVAATYMRGIRYVQIPTTLLAMVDSSFGGKTGINTPYGKNLVGAFHQPSRVYVDLLYLNSLSKRHISNGMSEIIKLAAVFDSEAFAYLESHSEQVFQRDTNVLLYIVTSSIKRKAAIVTEDIKDSGLRNILNFGHSVGHALEILAPFCLLHGEAVAIGMFKEAEISRSLGYCRQATVNRLSSCLSLYGLKTAVPTNLNVTDIMRYLRIDKKNTTTGLRLIMIKSIGGVASPFLHVVDDTLVEVALSSLIEVKPKEAIHGTVAVPGSKSISNRALCLAALGSGPCMVKGILHADDTLVMCQALQALGVRITRAQADDCSLTVHGVNGQLSPPKSEIYVGSSGTTARFIASLVTLIVDECEVVITGSSRMKERYFSRCPASFRQNRRLVAMETYWSFSGGPTEHRRQNRIHGTTRRTAYKASLWGRVQRRHR
jgi:pentafunctional AROM polypeptide